MNPFTHMLENELRVALQERLSIGLLAIANCEWAFEETRNYVCERKAFGKTISNLPVSLLCCLHYSFSFCAHDGIFE